MSADYRRVGPLRWPTLFFWATLWLMVQRVFYGGQAVLEGVMMRGRTSMAVAVRAPSGNIVVHAEPLPKTIYSGWVAKTPFIRGLTMLWDTLGLGMKALMFSADVAVEEETAQLPKSVAWGSVAMALLLGVGIFFVTPVFIAGLAEQWLQSWWWAHIIEGVVRLGLFIGYVSLIGLFPDIKRVYMYHGAEHMTIHAFEHQDPLVPDEIRKYPTAHPRCGTAFLILIVGISIVVFAMVPATDLIMRALSRIVLIPLIAGVAYEILKLGGAYPDHPLMKIIIAPGLLVQAITTKQPDSDQIEVAVAAFEAMRNNEAETATA
ncbi:MAG: DUF1385 domain-containing protein [Chloroflexota bacterium]